MNSDMNMRINPQDEYLLSRLIDGDLPEDQAAVLRGRIEQEPALKHHYDQMCSLDRMLTDQSGTAPQVDDSAFHQRTMQQIALAGQSSEISKQDEFRLSELLDGTLSAAEASALRKRFDQEPLLRQRYEELTWVESLLAEQREDRPEVDHAAFRETVQRKIAAESGAGGRIIRFPLWAKVITPLAAAAAVALVVLLPPERQEGPRPGSTGNQIAMQEKDDQSRPVGVARIESDEPSRTEPAKQPKMVVALQHARPTSDSQRSSVTVTRTGPSTPRNPMVRISYTHSEELSQAVHQQDRQQRRRPGKAVYYSVQSQPDQQPVVDTDLLDIAGFFDAAAL